MIILFGLLGNYSCANNRELSHCWKSCGYHNERGSGVTAGGGAGGTVPRAAQRENQPTDRERRGVVKKRKRRGKGNKGRKERRKRKGKRRRKEKKKRERKERVSEIPSQ